MTGIFTLQGFKQTDREESGLDYMQSELKTRYKLTPTVTVFDSRTWKGDMRGLAALAKRRGVKRAIIQAYSHGAGYAAPRLCKALHKRGIKTVLVLLCDPVYRPLWLPRWTIAQALAFRALIPKSAKIKFPKDTGPIFGIRQEENIPRGFPLKVGGQKLILPVVKHYNHSQIDDCPQWRDLVRTKVAQYV